MGISTWPTAVIFVIVVTGATRGEEWSYDYESQWPGKCNEGRLQSPINIVSRAALVDRLGVHIRGPLAFRGYGRVNVTAANNGHTLKWMSVEGSEAALLSGGPLRASYRFLQLHLHWLSEHAIDGMKYPLEIHMVHIKSGLTVDEALKQPDGLAVIGVLCQVSSGGASEYALGEIERFFPDLVERHSQAPAAAAIDVARLLSPEPQSFFTYQGSLTTPMCQEVVTWIVMDKPLLISDTQYKQISRVDVGGVDNYRSLQAAERDVFRSAASCAARPALPPALPAAAALAALLHLASALSATLGKGVCALANVKRKVLGSRLQNCSLAR